MPLCTGLRQRDTCLGAGVRLALLLPEAAGAEAVFEAARSGDAVAERIVQEVATNLGVGIVSLLNAFDPEAIVIGGGMSQSLDLLLPGVNREIELHSMAHQRGGVPIVRAELGDDVGLLGAAALAFAAHDSSDEAA